jgi:hypothetical protein
VRPQDPFVEDEATADIFEALFDIRSDTQEILRLLTEDDDAEEEEEEP